MVYNIIRVKGIINAAITEQVVEYRGFVYFKSLNTWELKKVLKAWSGNDESVPYALAYGSLSRGSDFAHLMDIIRRNNLSNRRDQVWQFIAERILMEL